MLPGYLGTRDDVRVEGLATTGCPSSFHEEGLKPPVRVHSASQMVARVHHGRRVDVLISQGFCQGLDA